MLREVRLYGHLARRFGRVHRFDVASPAEAVAALRANFPGFQAHVLAHNEPGYRVIVGKRGLTREQLALPAGGAEPIRIVPVVAGAKRGGIGQIILGTVLIVAGSVATTLGFTPVGKYLVQAGIASMLGGVVQLLTPQPPGPKERPENQPSYFFDGAVNTTAQGQPVPALFGRLVVGGAVISTGINAEEIAQPQAAEPPPPARPQDQPLYYWESGTIGGGN